MSSYLYIYLYIRTGKIIIYKMAGVLKKIFNLFIILRLFYVHSFLATFKTLLGISKECQMEWARLTFNYLKVKLKELRGHTPLKQGKTMVYANHRSQADFFLDNVVLNYQTNFLSRLAVLLASPGFAVSYKSVWFFNRNNKTDPEKFNQWLDKKFSQSPRPALLVYPEGHRMQGSIKVDDSKMKTGMIKYAYRRKMPSQILMTFGNEDILDQKSLHISFGETCYYKLSQVIDPADFQTEAAYIQKIKQRFCQFFDEVYAEYLVEKQKTKTVQSKDSQRQKLLKKQ